MDSQTILSTKKGDQPENLLWLDMEFSGLDVGADLITEVACIVTDFKLNELATYQTGIYHDEAALTERISQNPWFEAMGDEYRQVILKTSATGIALEDGARDVLKLIDTHWSDSSQGVILAGNSIHSDRSFIRAQMPALEQALHYRMLDVSALKVYMQGRYGLSFNKSETHRALDDIRESIAELRFYTEKWSIDENS